MKLNGYGNRRAISRTAKYEAAQVEGQKLSLKWDTAKELYQQLQAQGYGWLEREAAWQTGVGYKNIRKTDKYIAAIQVGQELGLTWQTARELYQQLHAKGYEWDNDEMWLNMCH